MNVRSVSAYSRLLAMAIFAMSVSLGVAAQSTPTPTNLADQISAAKSKADHEAMAVQFDKQARTDMAMAEQHTTMAKAYSNAPWTRGGSVAMATHCKSLAKNYKIAAKQNEKMAEEHRKLAAKLP